MERTTTQQLVDRLTQRMDLHRIFLFFYPYLEEEQQHLLLVVNPIKGLAPATMAPIVSLCMSDGNEIPFDLVLTGEWQNQLKQGSLYYTYASSPQHELYASSKKVNPLFSNKTITSLLELAALNYEKCRKASDEFREGVNNFLAKGDFGRATFMLHQFLELRLKGFLSTSGMNGGKSHNIEHLMKRLRSVFPQLQLIFPYEGPSIDLFRLLDQSYVKAKKQETIEITEEDFDFLLGKCELARDAMDEMVASMVTRIKVYQEQFPNETEKPSEGSEGAKAKPVLESEPVNQIICEDFSGFPWPEQYKRNADTLLDNIYKTHRPEQITMLNYHTGGFSGRSPFGQQVTEEKGGTKLELYLVVLMKSKGPFQFRCMEVGVVSAMVIYVNIRELERKLAEGDRFFHSWWTKGNVLRTKSTFEPSFSVAEVDWKAVHAKVGNFVHHAKAQIVNLNEVIQDTSLLTLDTGTLLLRNLLDIGVTTYLRFAVGYIPRQLNLAERIDWSGIACRRIVDYTYPSTQTEKVCMHFILNSDITWRPEKSQSLLNTPQTYYRDKAGEMVKFFEGIFNEVLEELEGKGEGLVPLITVE